MPLSRTATTTLALPVVRSQAWSAWVIRALYWWGKSGSLGVVDGTQRVSSGSSDSRAGRREWAAWRSRRAERSDMLVSFVESVCESGGEGIAAGAQTGRRGGAGPAGGSLGGQPRRLSRS